MEVKINKEIRNYTESIFFGLTLRQCIFSALACGVAVGLYVVLKPYFGIETLSWLCILAATPFAVLGFVQYNGMKAEAFIVAWVKSEILMPKIFTYQAFNLYDVLRKSASSEPKQTKQQTKTRKRKRGHHA